MNETHDPEDELDQMLDRTVDDVAKAIKEREIPKYDGVQGEPPEWVPEWAVLYFEGYRDRLLSDRGFEVSALLKLIEQYRSIVGENAELGTGKNISGKNILMVFCFLISVISVVPRLTLMAKALIPIASMMK